MTRRRHHQPGNATSPAAIPAPPEDRTWAARAASLQQEKPAQWAALAATFALMAALLAWVAVLISGSGDIRFKPTFWLLALPFVVWCWGARTTARWTMQTMGIALLGAPCLALSAMLVAVRTRGSVPGDAGLATPLAMEVILALTLVLAGFGLLMLRRSSLPGGTRPVGYLTPGSQSLGLTVLPPDMLRGLTIGSLTLSGALINGMLFGIVSMIDIAVPADGNPFDEPLWLLAIPILPILLTGVTMMRGRILLRRRPGTAAVMLRWGMWIGAASSMLFFGLLWAWPTSFAIKLGMSVFMLPVALTALWSSRKGVSIVHANLAVMLEPHAHQPNAP